MNKIILCLVVISIIVGIIIFNDSYIKETRVEDKILQYSDDEKSELVPDIIGNLTLAVLSTEEYESYNDYEIERINFTIFKITIRMLPELRTDLIECEQRGSRCDTEALREKYYLIKANDTTIISDVTKLNNSEIINLTEGIEIRGTIDYTKSEATSFIVEFSDKIKYPIGVPLIKIGEHSAHIGFKDDTTVTSISTNCATPSTVGSIDLTNMAGDNITIIASLEITSSDTNNERIVAGKLQLINRSGGLLWSNGNDIDVGAANTANNDVILFEDENTTASQRYNITACSDTTAVDITTSWLTFINTNTTFYQSVNKTITSTKGRMNLTVNTTTIDSSGNRLVILRFATNITTLTGPASIHIGVGNINITNSKSGALLDFNRLAINMSATRPANSQSLILIGYDTSTGGSYNDDYNFSFGHNQSITTLNMNTDIQVLVVQIPNTTYTNSTIVSVSATTGSTMFNLSTNYLPFTPICGVVTTSMKDTDAGAEQVNGGDHNISASQGRINISSNNKIMINPTGTTNAAGTSLDQTLLFCDYTTDNKENYTVTLRTSATQWAGASRGFVFQAGDANPPTLQVGFIRPTPPIGTNVLQNNTILNITITQNNSNVPYKSINLNWNNTNVTIDDPSLKFYMNCENNTNDFSRYNVTTSRRGGVNASSGDISYFDRGCGFNGVDGTNITTSSFTRTSSFTITFWLYHINKTTTNGVALIMPTSAANAFIIWPNNSFGYTDGVNVHAFNTVMPERRWMHVALKCEGSNSMMLFVNGTNTNNRTITCSEVTTGWTIGGVATTDTNWGLYGYMDEVRFWNRNLSNVEISLMSKMHVGKHNSNTYYVNMSNQQFGIYNYSAFVNITKEIYNISESRCVELGTNNNNCPDVIPTLNITSPQNVVYTNSTINVTYNGTFLESCRISVNDVYNMSFIYCQNYTLSPTTFGNDTSVLLALPFDENLGSTIRDRSVYGLNGTLYNITFNNTNPVRANYSSYVTFDSLNDVINISANSSMDNIWVGGATVCGWYYPTQVNVNHGGAIVSKGRGASGNVNGVWDIIESNYSSGTWKNSLIFNINTTGLITGEWYTQNVTTYNKWNHFCVGYDNSSNTNDPIFWVNGSVVPTLQNGGNPTGSMVSDAGTQLYIGNIYNTAFSSNFQGSLDEIIIYDRILTDAEVKKIYDEQAFNGTHTLKICATSGTQNTTCASQIFSIGLITITPQLNIVSPQNTTYSNSTINITYTGTSNVNCRIETDGTYNMTFRFCQNYTLSPTTFGNDTNVSIALSGDEMTGTTTYDKSIFGLNVSLNGAIFNNSNPVRSNYSGYYTFDTSTDYLNATRNTSLGNLFAGGATICTWVIPSSFGGSNFMVIGNKDSGIAGTGGWDFAINNIVTQEKTIEFIHGFTTPGIWISPTNSITLNAWQHVCVAYNSDSTSNTPAFYVNGSQVATTQVTGPIGTVVDDSGEELIIGNSQVGTRVFDGSIDDFIIYNRNLSQADILKIYQEQAFNGTHQLKIYTNSTSNTYNSTNISFSISPPSTIQNSTWWNLSWGRSRQIIINPNISTDQLNVPVFVDLEGTTLTGLEPNCNDVRMLTDNNLTLLAFSIENGTCAKINMTIVVQVNLTANTNTSIYIYYNLSGASSIIQAPSPFDKNYTMRFAFWEGSGTTRAIKSDTQFSNVSATLSSAVIWNQTGIIDVPNSTFWWDVNSGPGGDPTLTVTETSPDYWDFNDNITIETWINISEDGDGSPRILLVGNTNTANHIQLGKGYNTGSDASLFCRASNTGNTNFDAASTSSTVKYNVWHHAVCVFNGTRVMLYIDGVINQTSSLFTGTRGNPTDEFAIGNDNPVGSSEFHGHIDEVRVHNVARSADYIHAVYYTTMVTPNVKSEITNPTFGNTCTPTNGQNWLVTCSDYCTITGQAYTVNDWRLSGSGFLNLINSNVSILGNLYRDPLCSLNSNENSSYAIRSP